MKEVITLHLGQAGIQEGTAMWDLLCNEHTIQNDGLIICPERAEPFDSFFNQISQRRYIPRAIFVDTDPGPIIGVKSGSGRSLFRPSNVLLGSNDVGSVFGRAYKGQSLEFIDSIIETIRQQAEFCDSLRGILMLHGMGGGTGSGLGAHILEYLADYYDKNDGIQFLNFPPPEGISSVVAPYNACFYTNYTINDCHNCGFLSDNKAMGRLLSIKLRRQRISLSTMNQLVAQTISLVTAPMRFEGLCNVTFSELITNLVPIPSLRFPVICYAPIHEHCASVFGDLSVGSLTNTCFERDSCLVSCGIERGKIISCCMLYRGNILPVEINEAIQTLICSGAIKFTSWVPSGMKTGVCTVVPRPCEGWEIAGGQNSAMSLLNTTAVEYEWLPVLRAFHKMYQKRAFVHWYLQAGMEIDDFFQTENNITDLIYDCREANIDDL